MSEPPESGFRGDISDIVVKARSFLALLDEPYPDDGRWVLECGIAMGELHAALNEWAVRHFPGRVDWSR